MKTFQIECGKHKGIVDARSEFSAWRKIVGKADEGFAVLARFRVSHPATAGRKHRAGWGVWHYVEPRHLDMKGR
jgi:hypothetical protein